MKFLFDRKQEFEIPGLPMRRGKVPGTSTYLGAKGRPSRWPSMPGIEGRREGRPLAPKRGAREEGEGAWDPPTALKTK